MWLALASVYETAGRTHEAIKAHVRALVGAESDTQLSILATLARLHAVVDDRPAAAAAHRRYLAQAVQGDGKVTQEMARSWLWLGKWEMEGERDEKGEFLGGVGGGGTANANLALVGQYLRNVMTTVSCSTVCIVDRNSSLSLAIDGHRIFLRKTRRERCCIRSQRERELDTIDLLELSTIFAK